ncbi:phosphoribosylpyrophosphate synthetase [Hymenobacter busanensis]|uniref:Phosphoribosylpyrophosphate synthetase n=1 Tax=Hymenobacter busanensis TaxID=2607656 RepID=A0A7L5A3P2_9BACT|nr:phosphoribosylpyrophosphate synthetase [Hymenobacter busanensis]KAA9338391.1 phosphoribosylpyrophosphate synthetase [Hymenobacter busanensis]QHJ09182.1 phosphoribosylpyrophosphate synthetase [Hymenobacter busanensis]
METQHYDTLTQAVRDLNRRGFTADFNVVDDHLYCPGLDLELHPDEFYVREFHRFEGTSDPGDESVVYAIESEDGLRGLLVSAFGAYSEPWADALMHKLHMPHA